MSRLKYTKIIYSFMACGAIPRGTQWLLLALCLKLILPDSGNHLDARDGTQIGDIARQIPYPLLSLRSHDIKILNSFFCLW